MRIKQKFFNYEYSFTSQSAFVFITADYFYNVQIFPIIKSIQLIMRIKLQFLIIALIYHCKVKRFYMYRS